MLLRDKAGLVAYRGTYRSRRWAAPSPGAAQQAAPPCCDRHFMFTVHYKRMERGRVPHTRYRHSTSVQHYRLLASHIRLPIPVPVLLTITALLTYLAATAVLFYPFSTRHLYLPFCRSSALSISDTLRFPAPRDIVYAISRGPIYKHDARFGPLNSTRIICTTVTIMTLFF